MEYNFKSTKLRDLKKLPKSIQKKILNKIDFYTTSNIPLIFSESLKDKSLGEFKFRIGDYRATFDIKNNIIIILAIDHRKDIYK